MHQTFTETSPSGNPGLCAFNLVWQDGGEANVVDEDTNDRCEGDGMVQGPSRFDIDGRLFPYPSRIDDRCPHGESDTRRSSDQPIPSSRGPDLGYGFFTDAYDLFVIGTVAALVKVQWNLSTTQTSWSPAPRSSGLSSEPSCSEARGYLRSQVVYTAVARIMIFGAVASRSHPVSSFSHRATDPGLESVAITRIGLLMSEYSNAPIAADSSDSSSQCRPSVWLWAARRIVLISSE